MRKFVCAAVATLMVFGVALAEDYTAVISKVEDGKVTFKKFKLNKEDMTTELVDEQTLPTTAGVKVVKGKYDEDTKKMVATDAIEGGLKHGRFTRLDPTRKNKFGFDGGLTATITVEGGKITQVMVHSGGKGVKGGKKKDAE